MPKDNKPLKIPAPKAPKLPKQPRHDYVRTEDGRTISTPAFTTSQKLNSKITSARPDNTSTSTGFATSIPNTAVQDGQRSVVTGAIQPTPAQGHKVGGYDSEVPFVDNPSVVNFNSQTSE